MKKKKICIGVMAILIVFVLMVLLVLLKSKSVKIAENNMTNEQNIIDAESLEDNTTENVVEENLSTEEPIVENNEIVQNEDTSIQVDEKNQETQKQDMAKEQTPDIISITKPKEIKPTQQEQPKPSTQVQENNNIQPNTEEKGNAKTDTNAKKQEAQAVQQNTITYKENENMIKKMKETIEKNKTENMETYGCIVTPDSSIVDQTSEFTFTEERMIGKIKYKFGTIKIYARDYYKNGVYQYTQCFML